MPTDIPPITFGTYFHIYNRGNNGENIFIEPRNYAYFMELWWKHTHQVFETWAYCLLLNHFHIAGFFKNREDLTSSKVKDPSQYFSNFFNAYSRSINIAAHRTGALFERPFKRIPIGNEMYLMRLIVYIHQNPQKHKFEEDFRNWNYSSYKELIASTPTRLQREKVLQLFGSREDFIRVHEEISHLVDFEDEE